MLVAVAPTKFPPGIEAPGTGNLTYDWRAPSGSAQNTRGVEAAYEVMELDVALNKLYKTDAHLVCYVVYKDGEPLEFQPRVNKSGLYWLYSQGYEVRFHSLFGDWDNPDHKPWNLDWLQDSIEAWKSNRWLQSAGRYYTNGGQRVVRPLENSVPVFCAERIVNQWILQAAEHGVSLDIGCKDWTRHYRLPWVVRDEKKVNIIPDLLGMEPLNADAWARVPRYHPDTLKEFGEFGSVKVGEASALYGWEDVGVDPPSRRGKVRALGSWVATLPPAWATRCTQVGLVCQSAPRGQRHIFYRHLAGGLLHLNVKHEYIPAIVCAIADAAGHDGEHHRVTAEDTVLRHASGHAVTGFKRIRSEFPQLAADLRAIGLGTKRVVTQATQSTTPLDKLQSKMRDEIRFSNSGITCIAAGCGTGKTHVATEVARDRFLEEELYPSGRTRPEARTVISSDKHTLSIQTKRAIAAYDVPVKRLFGPGSLKTEEGRAVCAFPEAAKELAAGGLSVPKLLCRGSGKYPCEYLDGCAAAKGWEGVEDAPIVVSTHAKLRHAVSDMGKHALTIIDEPPAAVQNVVLTGQDLVTAFKNINAFEDRYGYAMKPLLAMMTYWLMQQEPGAMVRSLRDIANGNDHLVEPRDIENALMATHVGATGKKAQDALACAAAALSVDAKDSAAPIRAKEVFAARRNHARSKELGRAALVLRTLQEAAEGLDAPRPSMVRVEEQENDKVLRIVCANHEYRTILTGQSHIVILDANAEIHAPAIKALTGIEPTLKHFAAEDGAPIQRAILPLTTAHRSHWLPHRYPLWQNGLLNALRRAIKWAQQEYEGMTTRDLCLITFRPIAVAIGAIVQPEEANWARIWKEEMGLHPKALASALEEAGPVLGTWDGTWTLGYYGGTKGMNNAQHCQALVTLGDPRPNVDAVEVVATFLELENEDMVNRLARAELEQATGRLRAPQRKTPGRMLHTGVIAPGGPGWDKAVSLDETEPPPRPPVMSAVEFRSLRTKLGLTLDQACVALKAGRRSIVRYEQGERAIPSGIAAGLRRLTAAGDALIYPAQLTQPSA